MAYKAKVVNKSPDYVGGYVVVTCEFFDDDDPTNILHKASKPFPSSFSLAELQAWAKAEGAEIRRKRQQVDALMATIPVGAEVVV